MSSEGFLKEMQTIGEKFLLKLQKLPKADPVEIVSFCVVLLPLKNTCTHVCACSLRVLQD
uniref:Uncharacterized protein n=2 Tax=Anas TaxID=8835 RepID=A0A8B9URL7_9AVES